MRRIVRVAAAACLALALPAFPAQAAPPVAGDDPRTVAHAAMAADGSAGPGTVPETVSIAAANHPPVAIDDPGEACGASSFGGAFPIPEDWHDDTALPGFEEWFVLGAACGLLANDSDPDGDPLTYEILDGPAHGATLRVDDTMVAYDPDPDYSTLAGDQPGGAWVSDSFTYRAFDGQAYSEPATMRFWIAPVNDPPTYVPGPGAVEVDEDSGPYAAPWATDVSPGPGSSEAGQAVHFEIVSLDLTGVPDLFAVAPAIDGQGELTFTPGADQHGLAHVTVRPKDDGGLEDYGLSHGFPRPNDTGAASSFDIVIRPVASSGPNRAPTAADDVLVVPEGGWGSLDPRVNDDDLDSDPLTIVAVTGGVHGTAVVTGGGSGITYAPTALYHGGDTLAYTVSDGQGHTANASIAVTVERDVTAPVPAGLVEAFAARAIGSSAALRVGWTGADAGSGIARYELQVSTDGGAYRRVALADPGATSVVYRAAFGSVLRFRVRATDREGNRGPFVSWPALRISRHQETTSLATYRGTWARLTGSHLSGGHARSTTSPARRMRFAFTGRDVAWVATRSPSGGRAEVRIDGVVVATVSLRARSTAYRRVVFHRHFASRTAHTLEIRPLGDGRVDIDAFLVAR